MIDQNIWTLMELELYKWMPNRAIVYREMKIQDPKKLTKTISSRLTNVL